jgi:hypothetical protein
MRTIAFWVSTVSASAFSWVLSDYRVFNQAFLFLPYAEDTPQDKKSRVDQFVREIKRTAGLRLPTNLQYFEKRDKKYESRRSEQ